MTNRLELQFAPATKEKAKARIALCGPSGSGKTYTALTLATILAAGGEIGLIDTERGSAAKYAHLFTFQHLPLTSFSPEVLPQALAVAAEAGFAVVVVDGLSHFWMGIDGMLQQVDHAARRSGGGNNFAGWKEARPMEQAMIDALLAYPGHLIVTMRTKTEWVVELIDGKNKPRKIGTKPEQREGIEYEFDVVGDMDLENVLTVSKSRIESLSGAVVRKPDADFARTVLEWLSMGADMTTAADLVLEAFSPEITADRLLALHARAKRRNLLGAALVDPETGQDSNLGAIIVRHGYVVRDAERKAAQEATAAAAETEAPPPPPDTPDDGPKQSGRRRAGAQA